MPKVTLIARLADGLPLAASMADEKDAYAGELDTYERQAKNLVRTLATQQNGGADSQYVTVESGTHFSFHYATVEGVIFLTLTERAYPKRLAFDYLDELRREFFTVYGTQVPKASRPYEFIRFDTFIQKTKRIYGDSRTQRNLDRISTELRDVHSIMTKNINDVISRGEKLESTSFILLCVARIHLYHHC